MLEIKTASNGKPTKKYYKLNILAATNLFRLFDFRGKLLGNSNEISRMALLSPACYKDFIKFFLTYL